ncbi:MAG: hypothetical protein JNK02_16760 [Planctomycetes bacterium]|nr:hypothetical protein [Planctomycetota bacterium]
MALTIERATSSKVIFTHAGRVEALYGSRAEQVWHALARLAEADRRRGIETRLVRLDVRDDVTPYRASPLSVDADPRAFKTAVDACVRARRPEYVLLLGGPDVVPQQPLAPTLTDSDRVVPSDLPYACDAPYSIDVRAFTCPTRVVGRLPGITGDRSPQALVASLRTATSWRPREREEYADVLAIAARPFEGSTASSLEAIFGHPQELQLVPPRKCRWSPALLARRTHFINCHGVEDESEFEGEDGDEFPTAHSAPYVAGKLSDGTVAAVECCYGSQMYDPRVARSFESMVHVYLRHGAYAYFGSSTSTYAPETSSGQADLICRSFLRHVLAGASAGRAALEARHEYLHEHPTLDPTDLKTLAQFALFGDPSVHPVAPARSAWIALSAGGMGPAHAQQGVGRSERRLRLAARGAALHAASMVSRPAPRSAVEPVVMRELIAAARAEGGTIASITSHRIDARPAARRLRRACGARTEKLCVAVVDRGAGPGVRRGRLLLIAHVEGGRIGALRRVRGRT